MNTPVGRAILATSTLTPSGSGAGCAAVTGWARCAASQLRATTVVPAVISSASAIRMMFLTDMSSDLQQELQRHEEAAGGDGDAIGHRLLGEGGIAAHEQQVRGNDRPLDLVIEPKNQRQQATEIGRETSRGRECK